MSCDVECLATYACNTNPELPLDGAVFAPYVKLGFGGEGREITVGNLSSAPDHHAVIKSFEWGYTQGYGGKIEIFDEEGSNFKKAIERLNKTIALSPTDHASVFVEWGWIITDCYGNTRMNITSQYGGIHYGMAKSISVAYEQGKIKYVLEIGDMHDRIAENRIEKNEGREDSKKPLKQAIRDLFRNNRPSITDVKFIRQDGSPWCFNESDGGCEGPYSVWPADQQNALATVRKWIAPLTTDQGKGIVIFADPKIPESSVIFMEDPQPGPGEIVNCCDHNLGTYIVNGGKCSPVLSFSPTINWSLQSNAGSGGNAAGGMDGGTVKQTGRQGANVERVGIQASIAPDGHANMWRPQPQIVPKAQDANAAHEFAVRLFETPSSISAELKIIGDPSLSTPIGPNGFVTKNISIVVINPYHIVGGADACEWLAQPICNETLSNKNWRIESVNHQIKEGSYVTILKVVLDVPNEALPPGTPLGGAGCGTQTFDNDAAPSDD